MKRKTTTLLLIAMPVLCIAQGGWVKNTDPANAITQYTTIFPYVGAAFVDINSDNYPDLFAAPKTLFLNKGDGTFDLLTPLNFNPMAGASGSSWADLDNDGDNDCAVASTPSRIYLNNGQGVFSNVTAQAPGLTNYGSWACAIGDYNKDEQLDIIFAHANGYHPGVVPSPCKLYIQSGAPFSLQSVGGYPFTTLLNTYTNPFWSDYDLDGDMDLFIASGPVVMAGLDPCYKNLKMETGTDTLVQMTAELFATQLQDGQCYNFIDYDNDGDFDLCLTNYISAPTRFYQNNGGTYTAVSTPFTTTATNLANCWGDYDNDGDQDVIITNDNAISRYYRNNGNGTFTFLSGGFSTPTAVCGITNGDYDNDGDLDLFVNGIGNNGNTGSVGLYMNQTVAGDRNWVNFKLTGVASNKSAVGAIIRMKAVVGGNAVWQMREINAQNSFQSQNDLRIHFGLNDAVNIDSVIVRWPSGLAQHFSGLTANNFYTLTEGEDMPVVALVEPGQKPMLRVFPNPATSGALHIQASENILQLTIYDEAGKQILHRDFGDYGAKEAQIETESDHTPPGLLILEVKTESGRSVQKVIRQ
ncbi:MAG TPA: FG-GAP-like repeat-containing protein [Saprospiraceae bacterium]|nr:FG-GAP-like repeat-containing protein [Saprospiraceae bacterium]